MLLTRSTSARNYSLLILKMPPPQTVEASLSVRSDAFGLTRAEGACSLAATADVQVSAAECNG